jgi:hypothetical protein
MNVPSKLPDGDGLWERLMQYGFGPILNATPELRERLCQASKDELAPLLRLPFVKLNINCVAAAYWGSPREEWDLCAYASLLPPWPLSFYTYDAPAEVVTPRGSEPFRPGSPRPSFRNFTERRAGGAGAVCRMRRAGGSLDADGARLLAV